MEFDCRFLIIAFSSNLLLCILKVKGKEKEHCVHQMCIMSGPAVIETSSGDDLSRTFIIMI